jgi:hypothetical protein
MFSFNVTSFCAQIASFCREFRELILEIVNFLMPLILFGGSRELAVSIAQYVSIFDKLDLLATGGKPMATNSATNKKPRRLGRGFDFPARVACDQRRRPRRPMRSW